MLRGVHPRTTHSGISRAYNKTETKIWCNCHHQSGLHDMGRLPLVESTVPIWPLSEAWLGGSGVAASSAHTRSVVSSKLSQTEVENFDAALRGEHRIFRFEVAMDEITRVRGRQRAGDVSARLQHGRRGERPSCSASRSVVHGT